MSKRFVFVLMPFDAELDDLYHLAIKPACQEAGAVSERVDEQIFQETILQRVYDQIRAADVIVAVMSGRNANVFYEVGYAHAIGKTVILLTSSAADIPFDLKHFPHIIYEGSLKFLRGELLRRISYWLHHQASGTALGTSAQSKSAPAFGLVGARAATETRLNLHAGTRTAKASHHVARLWTFAVAIFILFVTSTSDDTPDHVLGFSSGPLILGAAIYSFRCRPLAYAVLLMTHLLLAAALFLFALRDILTRHFRWDSAGIYLSLFVLQVALFIVLCRSGYIRNYYGIDASAPRARLRGWLSRWLMG